MVLIIMVNENKLLYYHVGACLVEDVNRYDIAS